jgi:hypothetical protein
MVSYIQEISNFIQQRQTASLSIDSLAMYVSSGINPLRSKRSNGGDTISI